MDPRIAFRCKPAKDVRAGDTLCFSDGTRLVRSHVVAASPSTHNVVVTLAAGDLHVFPSLALVACCAVEVEVGRDMHNLTDL